MLLLFGLGFCAGGERQGKAVLHFSSYCFFTHLSGGVDGLGESVFMTPSWQVEAVTSRLFLKEFMLAWS